MRVRAATAADRAWIAALLESFGWDVVALRGELFRALDHPMLVAESDGGPEGLLTYILRDGECEILTLQALRQWAGVRAGAVVESRRRLKPTIPEVGEHGIPIRDEIELEITPGTD